MARLFFIFIGLIPLVYGQCDVEKAGAYFKRSVFEFSSELVDRIAEDAENHFVTSAFSPYTLLAALSLGATGQTYAEIDKVLRLHPHKCFNKKFFEVIKQVTTPDDGVTLERSATIFADRTLPIKEEFKTQIQNTEVTKLVELTFDNPETVASVVNQYVKEGTRGTIEDIVSANDLNEVYIILVDAIYFKGTWKYQFAPEDTETSAFYSEQGSQIGDVSLMFSNIETNLAYVSQIEATVLELPYTSERYSMLFILPDPRNTVSNVIDKLKKISLKTILVQFTGTRTISVQIPKFKISSDLDNLKELLIDMGLRTMFEQNAEFQDLSSYGLFVSNFIQKAFIEVTEEGTEASVVSAATMEARSSPEQFTANRPFLFMIIDKQTEIVLFTGAYSKPSL